MTGRGTFTPSSRAAQLGAHVLRALERRGWTLSTCESLTAGLIAATLAEVPGASAVLRGGLITYASDLKATLAGVDAETIERHGVINASTARQMAMGAAFACGTDVAIAATGVAGPDPQDGCEPGTIWLGLVMPGMSEARGLSLEGDRDAIRQACVEHAFEWILEVVDLPASPMA